MELLLDIFTKVFLILSPFFSMSRFLAMPRLTPPLILVGDFVFAPAHPPRAILSKSMDPDFSFGHAT